MAGFMDMLGKRPETESGSSYQRTVLREVARKLNDLEEQNEQNALAIEEVRKLQRTVLQRLDAMRNGQGRWYWRTAGSRGYQCPDRGH